MAASCTMCQHLVIAPAGVAQAGPVVVVPAVAAHVEHGIDGAGASQCFAAWLVALAAIETGLWHGFKQPVGVAALGQQGETGRAVNQYAFINQARFQQGHVHRGVFRQTGS